MVLGKINYIFALVAILPVSAWLVFAYWQFKLLKRILVVSKRQHPIPENVFWMKRARMAIDSDVVCQGFVRKRNIWALFFFLTLVAGGGLIAYSLLSARTV